MNKIKMIDLPMITDDRGNLSFLEGENHVTFKIMRSYWICNVPRGCVRDGLLIKV